MCKPFVIKCTYNVHVCVHMDLLYAFTCFNHHFFKAISRQYFNTNLSYVYTQIVTVGEMFQNKSILYWPLTENGGHFICFNCLHRKQLLFSCDNRLSLMLQHCNIVEQYGKNLDYSIVCRNYQGRRLVTGKT